MYMMMENYLILLLISFGLIIVSIVAIIYLITRKLKLDTNAFLSSLIILGIVISLLIATILGIIQDYI